MSAVICVGDEWKNVSVKILFWCRVWGVSQVRGYLDNQVSPMIKHFGAHGAPQGGLNLASVSCGQRELLSIYLKTF